MSLAAARPAACQLDVGTPSNEGHIAVFDAEADGDAEPVRVIGGPATGVHLPQIMVVDGGGSLYVTSGQSRGDDDTVRVFPPDATGDVAPARVIAGPHTGLRRPSALALDGSNRLYVGNSGHTTRWQENTITVYDVRASGDASPIRTLAGGLVDPEGYDPHRLTFGRRDSLYVRTAVFLAVFAPAATGASVPARLIFQREPAAPADSCGSSSMPHSPERFALDRYDSMYVLSGDTVLVYPPGYTAVEPAVRRITGPRTGIHKANDIALDDRGWLYVVDRDSSLIKAFPPGATGDVAPTRRIGGPSTRLRLPVGVAFDRRRRLYVANWGGDGTILQVR